MNPQTTKVKNGKITLPRELRKSWEKADVFIEFSGDTIFIKRLSKPTLTLKEMMDKFRWAARKTSLSRKDVEKAIQEVRKETYKTL